MAVRHSEKVLIGLSGGADSAVAASMLKEQGYGIVAVTVALGNGRHVREAVQAARRISKKLCVPHSVVDISREFGETVVRDFRVQYEHGKTPNPCVVCNHKIKFPVLLSLAARAGAQAIATGHYARIVPRAGGPALLKGVDESKDQSYFLYRLRMPQLRRILFPLGTERKARVREYARHFRLPVLRSESQEACFLGGKDYRSFLLQSFPAMASPGAILDTSGRRIGTHQGIALYTVGQRERLGALGFPAYVVSIDPRRNVIVAGRREETFAGSARVGRLSFIGPVPAGKRELMVKIRYNHAGAAATAELQARGRLVIRFKQPQFAVTPGQSAVLYDGERVLGGGIIER